MADEVVGSAYVVIRAITNQVRDDIRKGVKDATSGDTRELAVAGQQIGDKVGEPAGEYVGKHVKQGVTDSVREASPEFEASGRQIGDDIGRGVENEVKSLGSRIASIFRRDKAANNGGRDLGKKIATGIAGGISAIPILPFLLTLLVPAIGGVVKIISAYVAGAISLIGQLGPAIAGIGVAFLSVRLAALQAMSVFKLAFDPKNINPQYMARLKELQKEFQKFKDQLETPIQKTLFPFLTNAMNTLSTTVLPILKRQLVLTADVLGGIIDKFVRLTQTPLFQANFEAVLRNNNDLLASLGDALVHIADAIVTLLAHAKPVLDLFGGMVDNLAMLVDNSVKAAAATGALDKWFQKAADTMKQWGHIIVNFAVGLFNIFKLASGAGQTLADRIQEAARHFREWTSSAKGENSIKKFFENALPIIHQANLLIGAIFKALGASVIGNGNGTANFLRSLRKDVLPAIVEVAHSLSGLGPSLNTFVVSLAGLVKTLSDSGALGAFVDTLNNIFNGLSALFKIPVVGQLASWAVALVGVAKAFDLVLLPIGGLGTILKPIGELIGGTIVPALGDFAGALLGVGAAGDGLAASLGAALAPVLGPILLITAAVAALIVVFVVLYKKNEAFRALVQKAWSDIKKAVGVVVDFFVKEVGPQLAKIWKTITDGFSDIANSAAVHSQFIHDTVKNVLDFLVSYFTIAWNLLEGIVKAAWTVISGLISGALEIIQGILDVFFGILTGNWKQAWDGVKEIIGGALKIIISGLKGALQLIVASLKASWSLIKLAAVTAWKLIVAGIKGEIQTLIGLITGLPAAIGQLGFKMFQAGKFIFGKFIDGIKNVLGAAGGAAVSLGTTLINDLVDIINGLTMAINNAIPDSIHIPGPLPDINLPDNPIPQIPHFAKGGIVDKPTLALIGEAGPEAVVPLGPNSRMPGQPPVNLEVNVYNPLQERTSGSLMDALNRIANLGLLNGGQPATIPEPVI